MPEELRSRLVSGSELTELARRAEALGMDLQRLNPEMSLGDLANLVAEKEAEKIREMREKEPSDSE